MISNILAVTDIMEPHTRWFVSIGGLIVFLIYASLVALVIVGLIRLVRFLGGANKEIRLTRMEVGKLAEEVRQLRQELMDDKNRESSAKSL
jgi:hypothetical protein